jgi:4'-phosphopantetheinyl transferase EntD
MPLEKLYSPAPGQLLVFWKIQESPDQLVEMVMSHYGGVSELDWIKNEGQRSQSLAVRMAAWHGFKALGMEPVLIPRREKGPPRLGSGFISMSHCPELAAVFLSVLSPVGIDIEEPREQFFGLKKRFLNKSELDWVANDLHKITMCWTVKEAVYKLMRTPGLSFRSDLSIEPTAARDNVKVRVKKGDHSIQLVVQTQEVTGHCLAFVSDPLFAGSLH